MIRLSRSRSLVSALARKGGSVRQLPRQAVRCTAAAATHNIFPSQSLGCVSIASLRSLSTAVQETNEATSSYAPRPFWKLMAANRGEIATRIMRAGTELGCSTVGIYSHEGRCF